MLSVKVRRARRSAVPPRCNQLLFERHVKIRPAIATADQIHEVPIEMPPPQPSPARDRCWRPIPRTACFDTLPAFWPDRSLLAVYCSASFGVFCLFPRRRGLGRCGHLGQLDVIFQARRRPPGTGAFPARESRQRIAGGFSTALPGANRPPRPPVRRYLAPRRPGRRSPRGPAARQEDNLEEFTPISAADLSAIRARGGENLDSDR